ncbi:MAG: hypothetical protein SFY80_05715 [Verrucomicrobiota bacterium]|nr:hypothetical protein [Verrucomicrobiota bacterium]
MKSLTCGIPFFPAARGVAVLCLLSLAMPGLFSTLAAQTPTAPTATAAAFAGEPARLPYKRVGAVMAVFDNVSVRDKLVLYVMIQPRTPLPAGDAPLVLTLKSASGDRILSQSKSGLLLDLPFSLELMRENPVIEANKPKGSLNMNITVGVAYPGKLSESVAWYRDAYSQLVAASRTMGMDAPKSEILTFTFPEGSKPRVSLRIGDDSADLTPDKNGIFSLNLADKGIPDNAVLVLSQIAQLTRVQD